MNNIFFFQTKQILHDTIFFNQLKEQKIFYSYFLVDQNYYLFVYAQKSIDINFLYQSIELIEELDSKKRKIRSFRGFFLYALEIIQKGKDYEILTTNLQPFFWRKVKNIIRQNKKGALLEFLFGYDRSRKEDAKSVDEGSNPRIKILEDQIKNLQNQVTLLQQKVINLEAKLGNSKYPLSDPSHPSESSKTIQQDDYTFEAEKGPYLREKQSQIKNPTYKTKDIESNILSETSKIDFKHSDTTQQYDSNQNKTLNQHNFITLSNLSEAEKIEIIKTGFQLQEEGKISLKKYYESTQQHSLFQLKGYSIKYETIRRTKLYQQLKLSNN